MRNTSSFRRPTLTSLSWWTTLAAGACRKIITIPSVRTTNWEARNEDRRDRRHRPDLRQGGHEAFAASPNTGVNTITGEGLKEAIAGAQVVIDLTNSPSFEDKAVLEFFQTSGRNLLAADAAAGVRHHVALSIVGIERT